MPGPRIDYDALAAEYARHRRVHPEVLRRLAAGVTRATRALEVGCGTGNYIAALRAATGCAGRGVDPSERMLARARQNASGAWFAAGRAERLGVADGAFDLLFSVDVIHHVTDRAAAFAEARRALAPGGRVCTATDSEWIIRNRVPLSRYFPDTIEPELARYPRDGELRALMARAGFEGIGEETVAFNYELSDSGPYRDKAYSALHLISEAAFQRGLQALEADLRQGPVRCVSRYVLVWGESWTCHVHELQAGDESCTCTNGKPRVSRARARLTTTYTLRYSPSTTPSSAGWAPGWVVPPVAPLAP